MQSVDMLEYRLNLNDDAIQKFKDNHRALCESIYLIKNNLESVNNRILNLEKEAEKKKLKKYIIYLILTICPVFMTIMFFIMEIEHQSIIDVLNNVETWVSYIQEA